MDELGPPFPFRYVKGQFGHVGQFPGLTFPQIDVYNHGTHDRGYCLAVVRSCRKRHGQLEINHHRVALPGAQDDPVRRMSQGYPPQR